MFRSITTFAEFWPFYLFEHRQRTNRRLHFVGTGLAIISLITLMTLRQWHLLWIVLVVGYGFAWVGHFRIEKNKPASFKYPLWSFCADFKMFFLILKNLPNKFDLPNDVLRLTKSPLD